MLALALAAVLSQPVSDAPKVYQVPAGAILRLDSKTFVTLPQGWYVPAQSMMELEANVRKLRADQDGQTRAIILTAIIATAVGLVLGGGAVCIAAGPSCPLSK